jgi:heme/copper-type cytochrome/quinol oxidase subunit 2
MESILQIPVSLCWSLAAAFAVPGDGSLSVTNIFAPRSTPAEVVYEASRLVLVIWTGIFLVIGGLLADTIIRFRRRPADAGREPPQVYGNNQIKRAWTVHFNNYNKASLPS